MMKEHAVSRDRRTSATSPKSFACAMPSAAVAENSASKATDVVATRLGGSFGKLKLIKTYVADDAPNLVLGRPNGCSATGCGLAFL